MRECQVGSNCGTFSSVSVSSEQWTRNRAPSLGTELLDTRTEDDDKSGGCDLIVMILGRYLMIIMMISLFVLIN